MPKSLKETLDELPEPDKRLLDYAFEHQIPQFIRLPNGRFIGVNIGHLSYLEADLVSGVWRAGRDKSIMKTT